MKKTAKRIAALAGLIVVCAAVHAKQPPVLTDKQIEEYSKHLLVYFNVEPSSPKGRTVMEFGRDLYSDPLFLSYAVNLPAEVNPLLASAELVTKGLALLPDVYLRGRVQLVLKMMDDAPVTACAKLGSSPRYGVAGTNEALKTSLARLSDDDFETHLMINKEAMKAKLRSPSATPRKFSDDEKVAILVSMAKLMPEGEGLPWLKTVEQANVLSDSAFCDASKKYYRTMLKLKGNAGSNALRMEFSQ